MNVFSEEYLNWIAEKTKDGKSLFYDEEFSREEYSGIKTLFNEVDNYVKMFYVLDAGEFGESYNVKDRDNLYKLSILYGPSTAYSLTRDETALKYLDLENVKGQRLDGEKDQIICEKMHRIIWNLKRLHNMGVPMETVSDIVNKELRSLKMKELEERGPVKTLTQKNYSNE